MCYITVFLDEGKMGTNILSRDQAASNMSLPVFILAKFRFPPGYSFRLCLLQEEFKGSYKNTWA